ncbi:YdeI/OmpD-associated family protein [Sphingomonas sp. PP-CC-3G-468]|uniref:YdeI/OmpD-associated family protein n=1 Tax=Sphingomonas sp. PP-CC-3G-468 TaxID=2135656 RepID=UPI0010F0073A|nr:YdeI/OmpD-associated family protein [Sphingomonas sp. PP-CC-3G-468]TCM07446.1 uncharacterized protein YdeI (YjbR/CyaY-like superfamily) [Sphingomonas sp. PP-CC-3G-468]
MLHFPDAGRFADWLSSNGDQAGGVWLMFAKKGSATQTIGRQDSIDAALCEGWIDGQGGTWDEQFFLVRFTPRRPRAKWSQVNRSRALELIESGEMRRRGLAQIEAAQADGRWDAAYPPSSNATLPPELQVALDTDPAAAARLAAMKRSDRYALILAIANGRRPDTRGRHVAAFLAAGRSDDE